MFNLPSKANGVTGAMLLAPASVSALRPPLMTNFSMPGSGSSQAESAVAHPILAQPDAARTAAIATLFNMRPRWERGEAYFEQLFVNGNPDF